jgi:hypothetical protein
MRAAKLFTALVLSLAVSSFSFAADQSCSAEKAGSAAAGAKCTAVKTAMAAQAKAGECTKKADCSTCPNKADCTSQTKAGGDCPMKTAQGCSKMSAKECQSAKAAGTCCETQGAKIDAKLLENIQTAAASGDFSKVAACPATREALKKLTLSSNAITAGHKELVLKAVDDQAHDFSKVAACKLTCAEIGKAVCEIKGKSLQTALNK